MKNKLLLLGLVTTFLLLIIHSTQVTASSPGGYEWAGAFGSTGLDQGTQVGYDSSGNLFVAGRLSSPSVDFDGAGPDPVQAVQGSADGFLVKYDTNRNLVWSKLLGGAGNDGANDVTTNGNNAYVVGTFNGTVDFDGAGPIAASNSAGSSDIYLVKYDASGNVDWVRTHGGTAAENIPLVEYDDANSVVYVVTNSTGTIDYDGAGPMAPLVGSVSNRTFIAKYDSNGTLIWAQNYPGTGHYDIAIDSSGDLLLAGSYLGTIDLDAGGPRPSQASTGNYDGLIHKISANSAILWFQTFGGIDIDQAFGIAVNSSGIFVSGNFRNNIDVDGAGPVAALVGNAGLTDSDLLIKYDLAGVAQSAITYLGIYSGKIYASNNDIYRTLVFSGSKDFDGAGPEPATISKGSYDMAIIKYDNNLTAQWSEGVGGASTDYVISIDHFGNNVAIGGYFYSTVDFDNSAAVSAHTAVGSADIFVAEYGTSLVSTGISPWILAASSNIYARGGYSGFDLPTLASLPRLTAAGYPYTTPPYLSTYGAGDGTLSILGLNNLSRHNYNSVQYNDEAGAIPPGYASWYDYYSNLITTNKAVGASLNAGNLSTQLLVTAGSKVNGVTTGNLTVNTGAICDIKGIILVNGDLTINPNFRINAANNDNGCIFIVSGDVVVGSGSNQGSGSNVGYDVIEAGIITDGSFTTALDMISGTLGDGLIVDGFVYADQVDLSRDVANTNNDTTPSEVFVFDPRFMAIHDFRVVLDSRDYSIREF